MQASQVAIIHLTSGADIIGCVGTLTPEELTKDYAPIHLTKPLVLMMQAQAQEQGLDLRVRTRMTVAFGRLGEGMLIAPLDEVTLHQTSYMAVSPYDKINPQIVNAYLQQFSSLIVPQAAPVTPPTRGGGESPILRS